MRISHVAALVLAILFVLTIGWLGRLDLAGPPHTFVELPGHEPATLYLPAGETFRRVLPPPPAERPPAVVLTHGFMSDRQMMSVLARRIADNGYAVLAIDVRGHGENRNPFTADFAAGGDLAQDVKEAVDFLRGYDLVDGSRIVVMGHSMGAGATLDYATQDPNLKGAVMISGGWNLGATPPKNALFIFAENDPEFIRQTSPALAARLAGVPDVELGKSYGDFGPGTAVEAVQIPGVDHIRILYSAAATATIVRWLDSSFGITRTSAIAVADPRLPVSGLALVIFVLLLAPLGLICGSIASAWPQRPAGLLGWINLLIFAAVMLAAMPLVAMIPQASFVPLVVGDIQASWFAVAGLILIVLLTLSSSIDRIQITHGLAATMLAAAIGFAVVYACQVPMTVTFHRLSFTPERLIVWAIVTATLLPFWFGFELLLRRGGVAISTVLAVIGRVLILATMVAGVTLDVLPGVVMLILPSLALIFVMIEIFAAFAYSGSRNLLLIALVESAWFAWVLAATSPITFML